MIKKMIKNNKQKNSGFSLIEMMVAVSIFVIVAFIVTTTLLTMSAAYKKSLKMRLLMDNLNFSVQSMAFDLREGRIDDVANACVDIKCAFSDVENYVINNNKNPNVCYKQDSRFAGSGQTIFKCKDKNDPCNKNCVDFISSEINIEKLYFDFNQSNKIIKIIVAGVINKGKKDETSFTAQTSVFQRASL